MRIVIFALMLPILNSYGFEIDTEADFNMLMKHLNKVSTPVKAKQKLRRQFITETEDKNKALTDLESQYFDSVSTKASSRKKLRVRSK